MAMKRESFHIQDEESCQLSTITTCKVGQIERMHFMGTGVELGGCYAPPRQCIWLFHELKVAKKE
jgi:hypothetical protein